MSSSMVNLLEKSRKMSIPVSSNVGEKRGSQLTAGADANGKRLMILLGWSSERNGEEWIDLLILYVWLWK